MIKVGNMAEGSNLFLDCGNDCIVFMSKIVNRDPVTIAEKEIGEPFTVL